MIARISGAWRTVTSAKVRVGNAWKTVRTIKAYIGGAWKEIASFIPTLTASISSSSSGGVQDIGPPVVYFVNYSATATPGGGLGPYTYSWALISGSGWAFSAPTAASTSIFGDSSTSTNGTARVTVTDAVGQTATADLTLTIS